MWRHVGQVVIALSATHFVLWPKSHRVHINPGGAKFHALSKAEMGKLEQRGSHRVDIAAQPGDVLVFLGGEAGVAVSLCTAGSCGPSESSMARCLEVSSACLEVPTKNLS